MSGAAPPPVPRRSPRIAEKNRKRLYADTQQSTSASKMTPGFIEKGRRKIVKAARKAGKKAKTAAVSLLEKEANKMLARPLPPIPQFAPPPAEPEAPLRRESLFRTPPESPEPKKKKSVISQAFSVAKTIAKGVGAVATSDVGVQICGNVGDYTGGFAFARSPNKPRQKPSLRVRTISPMAIAGPSRRQLLFDDELPVPRLRPRRPAPPIPRILEVENEEEETRFFTPEATTPVKARENFKKVVEELKTKNT
ncbi:Oidioi.mRNA.OKI2018_I69.PAR.g11539.t1.cds [Oikopleura dioica]|uniref:Oidioi.mRNA.OKI2018_I69.PAR.g11539.t1.cds n=1 Tax=Oikopleura dioica TaxID=34765 RepID=A0ABN7RWV1_OIKDI|nr:Oidioi.mRNA.OKI2018_I69.PAR.g11539.t1.cds [Oikopleura dioica]